MKKLLLTITALSAVTIGAHAQIIAQWNFNDADLTVDTLNPDWIVSGGIVRAPAIVPGTPGSTVPGISPNYIISNTWGGLSIDLGRYYEFALSNTSATPYFVTGFTFDGGRSNTGPVDWAFRSSADSFGSNLLSASGVPNGNGSPNDPAAWANFGGSFASALTVASTGTITFRLYGFNASNTTSGTFRTDNWTVLGAPIPEPQLLGVLSLGAITLIVLLKRRRALDSTGINT